MATKTTIEMAREAAGDDWGLFQEYMPEIHKLVELVRADEREACVKAIQKIGQHGIITQCVAAIRNRSNT